MILYTTIFINDVDDLKSTAGFMSMTNLDPAAFKVKICFIIGVVVFHSSSLSTHVYIQSKVNPSLCNDPVVACISFGRVAFGACVLIILEGYSKVLE